MVGGRCWPLEWRHWSGAEVSPPPSSLHFTLGRTGWLGPAAATDSTWRLVLVARGGAAATQVARHRQVAAAHPHRPAAALSLPPPGQPARSAALATHSPVTRHAGTPARPTNYFISTSYSIQIIQNSINSESVLTLFLGNSNITEPISFLMKILIYFRFLYYNNGKRALFYFRKNSN